MPGPARPVRSVLPLLRTFVVGLALVTLLGLVGCGGDERSLRPLGQTTATTEATVAAPTTRPRATTTTTDPSAAPSTTDPSGPTTSAPGDTSTTASTTTTTTVLTGPEAALAAAAAEAVEDIGELADRSCTEIAPGDFRCELTLTNGDEIRIDVLVNTDGTYTWEFSG